MRRKKFDATVDTTLQLAAKLGTLAPGTAVEAQDTMRRVTMVRSPTLRKHTRSSPLSQVWHSAVLRGPVTSPLHAACPSITIHSFAL